MDSIIKKLGRPPPFGVALLRSTGFEPMSAAWKAAILTTRR